jgi:hypothetical protein
MKNLFVPLILPHGQQKDIKEDSGDALYQLYYEDNPFVFILKVEWNIL